LLSIAILAVLPALAAQAAPQSQDQQKRSDRRQQDDRRDTRSSDSRSSLSDAVRRVERDTRGEVLSAERVQYDGRDMHRVKVVDDRGRVRVFMQDPRGAAGQQRSGNGGDRDSRSTRRDDD